AQVSEITGKKAPFRRIHKTLYQVQSKLFPCPTPPFCPKLQQVSISGQVYIRKSFAFAVVIARLETAIKTIV
ncbi:MAG: hypothetical protein NWR52_03825, partial [Paracoccaceae bacterium]|nr:hypothetical protein [Paracoccaceae bacterium]